MKYEQNAFIIIKIKFSKIIENEYFDMYTISQIKNWRSNKRPETNCLFKSLYVYAMNSFMHAVK